MPERPKQRWRVEKDVVGPKKVPARAYYGIHVVRGQENFPIGREVVHPLLIRAIACIKLAAAEANMRLGMLDRKRGKLLRRAAKEIIAGKFGDQFPLKAFTAGAGTPFNMAVNEVMANRALELAGKPRHDPWIQHHDHPNMSQSSNDVVPTAIRIASLWLTNDLLKTLERLSSSFSKKSKQFKNVIKAGRTHLRDAVPISLGQEFEGYAGAMEKAVERIREATKRVARVGLGGTAIGTGLNAHPKYRKMAIRYLKKATRLSLYTSNNLFETHQSQADLLELSDSLAELAVELGRICNDLRLLYSGPATGFNEIELPAVEPGSSIMPAKYNPSIPEAVNMTCYQVIGNSAAVAAAAGAGQLEINVMTPVIAKNLLDSLEIMRDAAAVLEAKCIRGIRANEEVCKQYFEKNGESSITALSPYIGYEVGTHIAQEATRFRRSIRELVAEKGLMAEKEIGKILKPSALIRPNVKSKVMRKGKK
jgi:aspartate ammonia-lyase